MNLWIYQLCSVWPCGLLFRPALIFRKVWKANSLTIECIQYNTTPSNSVRHLLCQGKNSTSQCYDVLCSLSIDCKVRRPTVLLNVCLTLCLCLPSCLSAEASTHLNSLAIQQVTINLDSNWAVAAQDFFRHGKSAESLELLKTVLQAQPSPTEPRVSKAWATWACGKIYKNQARNHSHRSCPCKPNKLWVGLTLPSRIMPRCVYALSIWPYSPSQNCIAASFFTLRQNTPQSGCDRVASPQNTEEKWIMKECMSECIQFDRWWALLSNPKWFIFQAATTHWLKIPPQQIQSVKLTPDYTELRSFCFCSSSWHFMLTN